MSAPAGAAYRLSDVELASRLSFFLWSSIPDDELLELAIRGKLRDPSVLEQQIRRMLADPRARSALVANFFSQWLQVRNVWLLTPDANRKFPWFDDNLRTAFVRETELFLESQLQEDRSVVDLLTADYTFLNEQLARHYGIPERVRQPFPASELSRQNRWGLLGKASILAVTSYPHRTSPTIRGKWLLENILAAPVPPPPPDVDTTLEEATSGQDRVGSRDAGAASRESRVRELSRADGSAGFRLENFDALGQWRTKDGDAPIDASGVLLDGTQRQWPGGAAGALLAAEGAVRQGGDGEAADVRGRPRDGVTTMLRRSARSCAPPPPTTIAGRQIILAIDRRRARRFRLGGRGHDSHQEGHLAPHRPSRRRRRHRLAAAGCDGAGIDRFSEDAQRNRCGAWDRLPPERGRLRKLAAQGRRHRVRVLARARAARALPRSRRSSSPGSPTAGGGARRWRRRPLTRVRLVSDRRARQEIGQQVGTASRWTRLPRERSSGRRSCPRCS